MSLCLKCGGTGRDSAKTTALARKNAEFKHRMKYHGTYIRCWDCNGNGLNP